MKNNFNNANSNNRNISNNGYRGESFSLSKYCKNTMDSLYCVESFLDNFTNYYKYVRLYKILK